MKMFGKGYECIEKVVEDSIGDYAEKEELEDGWFNIKEPNKTAELSLTQNESYFKQY